VPRFCNNLFALKLFLHPENPTIQQILKISMDISAGEKYRRVGPFFKKDRKWRAYCIKKKEMTEWLD